MWDLLWVWRWRVCVSCRIAPLSRDYYVGWSAKLMLFFSFELLTMSWEFILQIAANLWISTACLIVRYSCTQRLVESQCRIKFWGFAFYISYWYCSTRERWFFSSLLMHIELAIKSHQNIFINTSEKLFTVFFLSSIFYIVRAVY